LDLARYCRRVTLVVRGDDLAAEMSAYLIDAIESAANVVIHTSSEVSGGSGDGRLEAVTVRHKSTGVEKSLPTAGLFVMIGADPCTDWLPESVGRDPFGFVLAGS